MVECFGMTLNGIIKKRDSNMNKTGIDRMADELQTIKGGDFSNWYEGLSPIEHEYYTLAMEELRRKYKAGCSTLEPSEVHTPQEGDVAPKT